MIDILMNRLLMRKISSKERDKKESFIKANWTFEHTPLSSDIIKKIFKEGKMTTRR